MGQYRDRKIHQIDPQTGTILRTIESNRFVTGVTWVDGELWHGTWEGERAMCGESIPKLERSWSGSRCRPDGVSGLESDGGDQFFCGGGSSGKVRAVRRPTEAPRWQRQKPLRPSKGQYLRRLSHLYMRLHRRPPAEADMQEYFRAQPRPFGSPDGAHGSNAPHGTYPRTPSRRVGLAASANAR